MRLLVLGGTRFLGRALVEEALARGHQVTTFNRGRSGADSAGVEVVRGDRARKSDLAHLVARGPWDTALDTSGFIPAQVQAGARALEGQVRHYVFASTVNVYRGWPTEPLSEESEVRPCPPDADDTGTDSGADRYGRLKAGCERAVVDALGERRTLSVRPGVILGPREYVGRLAWWLWRMRRGGRMLAPGGPDRAIQPVDVRDVASFMIGAAEAGLSGALNLTAPFDHATFGGMLAACVEATASDAELVWAADDFLLANGVRMWTELPLWRVYPGTWRVDGAQARRAGFRTRPLRPTVLDTWRWLVEEGEPPDGAWGGEIGIDPEKEARILAAWVAAR